MSLLLDEPRIKIHTDYLPGSDAFRVDLAAIRIPSDAAALIADCLAQGAIGQSAYVAEFEREVAAYVGAAHCIATANGTLADAVMVAAMRVRYPKAWRVHVPALTFIAQPNAVRYSGLEVNFVDVREDWLMDMSRIAGYNPQVPIEFAFPTHLLGRCAAVGDLPAGMPFIEDACEAFGSRLDGRAAGTFGIAGSFSFFVSHTVTTGEGGAIVTDDPDFAALCRQLRSHGRASEQDAALKFSFPLPGFNAKLNGLSAALGVAVMRHAGQYVTERRAVFAQLNKRLDGRFVERACERVVPHAYPVQFVSETARDVAMRNLGQVGIECRRFFSSVPTEGAWAQHTAKKYPVAEHISRTHLLIPCHQNIAPADVDWMAAQVLAQRGLA